MLRLQTPITIGSQTYDLLIPGRGEWDLRARRINFLLTLAREEPNRIRIAKGDSSQGRKPLAPMPVLSLEIQDQRDDPVVNAVIQKFREALEALEQFIESQLTERVYQLGEDEMSLAATFEASGKEYRNELPAEPEGEKE